jgi:hypothetical protein
MKFGTINGNAAAAHDLALSILTGQPDSMFPFLRALNSARFCRYRHLVILQTGTEYFIAANHDYPIWWADSSLLYSAGSGIEVAAGLQQSTGSN